MKVHVSTSFAWEEVCIQPLGTASMQMVVQEPQEPPPGNQISSSFQLFGGGRTEGLY